MTLDEGPPAVAQRPQLCRVPRVLVAGGALTPGQRAILRLRPVRARTGRRRLELLSLRLREALDTGGRRGGCRGRRRRRRGRRGRPLALRDASLLLPIEGGLFLGGTHGSIRERIRRPGRRPRDARLLLRGAGGLRLRLAWAGGRGARGRRGFRGGLLRERLLGPLGAAAPVLSKCYVGFVALALGRREVERRVRARRGRGGGFFAGRRGQGGRRTRGFLARGRGGAAVRLRRPRPVPREPWQESGQEQYRGRGERPRGQAETRPP
jgi:hypothetical protein